MRTHIHLHAVINPDYSVYLPTLSAYQSVRAYHQDESGVVMTEGRSGGAWPIRAQSALKAAKAKLKYYRREQEEEKL